MKSKTTLFCALLALGGCGGPETSLPEPLSTVESPALGQFRIAGKLESQQLDEASGIQALSSGEFVVHNDEGDDLFIVSPTGKHRGRIVIGKAKNKDWEDITKVPGPDGDLIVIGDIGDNHRGRKSIRLYFVPEPSPDLESGKYPDKIDAVHKLKLRYPDAPRNAESLAWDSAGEQLLIVSKWDDTPRLYGVPVQTALNQDEAELEFLGEVRGINPPTRSDLLKHPKRGPFGAEPTGLDISPDGRRAALLTYRALYLYQRQDAEDWADAFRRPPVEYIGPSGLHDEAVAFGHDGKSVYVTTERRPAPLYRLQFRQ